MNSISDDFIRTLQVMVVDDDATFRRYLEVQLEMLGCHIVPMESGESAWDRIQAQPPDLVLTDVFMPGMTGLELCQRIKATPALEGIPVVLLTMAGPKAKDEGYKAGADDFLNKPPHLMELKTRLHNLLLLRSLRITALPDMTEAPSEPLPSSNPRVLMVESYGILREFARTTLAEDGLEFQGVDTVDGFLERLESERPDLVIIDQDLLEGLGSALVSRLRNQATTADLPILLMCDPSALGPGAPAWSAAADEHLVKPFEPPELRARVRALLSHAKAQNRKDAQRLDSDPSALRDPRSGAYTRSFLYASLDPLFGLANLAGRSMGLLACRLSETPKLSVLEIRNVAGILQSQLEPQEYLCRVAENLFVAVLPGADSLQLAAKTMALAPRLGTARIATVVGKGESGSGMLKRLFARLQTTSESAPKHG